MIDIWSVWRLVPICLFQCIVGEQNRRMFKEEELSNQSLRNLFFCSLLEWSQQFLDLDFPSFLNFLGDWHGGQLYISRFCLFAALFWLFLYTACIYWVRLLFCHFLSSFCLCLSKKKKKKNKYSDGWHKCWIPHYWKKKFFCARSFEKIMKYKVPSFFLITI